MLYLEKFSRLRLLMGLNQGMMLSKKLKVSLNITNGKPTTLGSASITGVPLPDRVFNNNNIQNILFDCGLINIFSPLFASFQIK